ncbi:hypothetical protein CC78DRAFT_576001 [Lojkania enalia]|uniref:Uncharacterized protein n=1 Tax=Lojkania enalia TaxID=147567 RepID=A0A9P4KHV8_9PLEO|nr:hypothetical protein CC78DRAFT_576001 [Didymosphaeria enalia]
MFRFSVLIRYLLQRLPTATLGNTRFIIVSEANDFVSAINHGERVFFALPSPKLNDTFIRTEILCTDSKGTKDEDRASRMEYRNAYRNRYGEEIIFNPFHLPPGYTFVPSGSIFITRRNCKLAQKLYVVYRSKSRKGLERKYASVPEDVFEKAKSDFETKRAKIDENVRPALDK